MVKSVIDIEDVVKTWAWTYFKKNHSSAKFDDYLMEVNWDKVQFQSQQAAFTELSLQETLEADSSAEASQILFKSVFDNHTNEPQENLFKTERTTTSSVTTSVQKGYRKGWNVGLSLAVPNSVVKFTTGYGRDVNIAKSEQNTTSTQLKWAIDNKVITPPNKRTLATLCVEDKAVGYKFATTVKIKGEVGVRVSLKSKPLEPAYYLQNDVTTVFHDNQQLLSNDVNFSENKSSTTWKVEGKMGFKFAVQQTVCVEHKELPSNMNSVAVQTDE